MWWDPLAIQKKKEVGQPIDRVCVPRTTIASREGQPNTNTPASISQTPPLRPVGVCCARSSPGFCPHSSARHRLVNAPYQLRQLGNCIQKWWLRCVQFLKFSFITQPKCTGRSKTPVPRETYTVCSVCVPNRLLECFACGGPCKIVRRQEVRGSLRNPDATETLSRTRIGCVM